MFRIAKDKWNSKQTPFKTSPWCYDKFWHFLLGAAFAIVNPIASAVFWALWEIKDAIVPWEAGYITWFPFIGKMNWGGDGFSWKDMTAAWIGVLIIFALTLIL